MKISFVMTIYEKLKGCVRYICVSLFFVSKSALVKLIQISWCQMPKHKTRKTFYGITWEVKTVC